MSWRATWHPGQDFSGPHHVYLIKAVRKYTQKSPESATYRRIFYLIGAFWTRRDTGGVAKCHDEAEARDMARQLATKEPNAGGRAGTLL